MITYEEIRKNEDIRTYIQSADEALAALGFTEHSFAHVTKVAESVKYILETLGFSAHAVELGMIAAYLHDIGNLVNRAEHSQSGAVMAFRILDRMDMPAADIATIVAAIGNHDDWWMDNKPALNLFESIEPNGTVELEGLGTVNLSHFPYREDLAYGWPDDAVRFHDQALPFDGRKLLYGHTHQLSPAGARPESLNVNSARTAGLR